MTAKQLAAIEKHGRTLLAIFPQAAEKDPVKLCKRLRRLENEAHKIALRCCNGPQFDNEEQCDKLCEAVLDKVDAILNYRSTGVNIRVNRDARGYALKVNTLTTGNLHAQGMPLYHDWGGYGIIAPEIGKNGE